MKIKVCIFLLITIFLWSFVAFAKMNIPSSCREFSADKKLVYVNRYNQEYSSAAKDFNFKNYQRLGLYELESRKFLWSIKNPPREVLYVQPLNDKQYVIACSGYTESPFSFAFAIYKNGDLIKKFDVSDFCSSQENWYLDKYWFADFRINDSSKTITINSCNTIYTIDITNGEVSKEYQLPNLKRYKTELRILGFFLCLFSVWILVAFIKKKNTLKNKTLILCFFILSILTLLLIDFLTDDCSFLSRNSGRCAMSKLTEGAFD